MYTVYNVGMINYSQLPPARYAPIASSGRAPIHGRNIEMNTRYYVVLEDGSEHLVLTGRHQVVDRADGAHVQNFDAIRNSIVSCHCLVFNGDTLQSVHHYSGMDASIVASMESRRKA